MTKIIYAILTIIFYGVPTVITAQDNYYWANGSKHQLDVLPGKSFVITTASSREALSQSLAVSSNDITEFSKIIITKSIEFSGAFKDEQVNLNWGIVSGPLIKNRPIQEIIYTAPFFLANGKVVGLSQFFYVKLQQQTDYSVLEKLALENNVDIIGRSKFMPLWYILSCTNKSTGNALEMANLFYETGMFSS
ncbi:MAG TPA: hypothetical protein PK951_02995 [Chitinophagaceae bacterium]|nr:hypothetical protein [Chitinophagaceae bacterium]